MIHLSQDMKYYSHKFLVCILAVRPKITYLSTAKEIIIVASSELTIQEASDFDIFWCSSTFRYFPLISHCDANDPTLSTSKVGGD